MIVDEQGHQIESETVVPPLTEEEEREAQARTKVTALVVHEAIRKEGDEELSRPVAALAWRRASRWDFHSWPKACSGMPCRKPRGGP